MEAATAAGNPDIGSVETTTAAPNKLISVHGNIGAKHVRVDADVHIQGIQRSHHITSLLWGLVR